MDNINSPFFFLHKKSSTLNDLVYFDKPGMNKNISFIIVSFLICPLVSQAQTVTNQRVYDTIPFIPEHTPQRLAQFAKEPIITGKNHFSWAIALPKWATGKKQPAIPPLSTGA